MWLKPNSGSKDNAIKELKVGYRTDTGDLKTKLRHAHSFLSDGNKAEFSMGFRGSEKAFIYLDKEKLKDIAKQFSDVARVYEQNFRDRISMHLIVVFD